MNVLVERFHVVPLLVLFLLSQTGAWAQSWDVVARVAAATREATGSKLALSFEQRSRFEDRAGNSFGNDVNLQTGLIRTRFGLTYMPVKWLAFTGMVQDSRAPFYSDNAPSSVRDQADLHEGYMELFPACKRGFGMTAGRKMLSYGEGRLI